MISCAFEDGWNQSSEIFDPFDSKDSLQFIWLRIEKDLDGTRWNLERMQADVLLREPVVTDSLLFYHLQSDTEYFPPAILRADRCPIEPLVER